MRHTGHEYGGRGENYDALNSLPNRILQLWFPKKLQVLTPHSLFTLRLKSVVVVVQPQNKA